MNTKNRHVVLTANKPLGLKRLSRFVADALVDIQSTRRDKQRLTRVSARIV
jgi:hypothetical protein